MIQFINTSSTMWKKKLISTAAKIKWAISLDWQYKQLWVTRHIRRQTRKMTFILTQTCTWHLGRPRYCSFSNLQSFRQEKHWHFFFFFFFVSKWDFHGGIPLYIDKLFTLLFQDLFSSGKKWFKWHKTRLLLILQES